MHTSFGRWIAIVTILLSACGGGDGEGNRGNGNNHGDPALDGPAAKLHIAAPDIKTLQLSWPDAPAETGYRVYEQLEGAPIALHVASLPANTTQHALSVFLPERLNARYSVQACNAGGCTAYTGIITVGNALLNRAIGYFKSDGAGHYGRGLVLSADGSTLAMNMPYDSSVAGDPHDVSLPDSGAVIVFNKGSAGWVRQQFLKAAVPSEDDRFGLSLALTADGNRMAIGSRGKVHVVDRANGLWAENAVLSNPQPLTYRNFAFNLALSGDGTTLAVGAEGSFDRPGLLYVYTRSALGWQDPPEQLMSDKYNDRYAHALAFSKSGNTLLIGAPTSTADAPPATPGVVHVFTRAAGAWSRQTQLRASNAGDGDGFGGSISLSADGLTAAIGARYEDSPAQGIDGDQGNGRLNSGAAYVFVASAGTWTQQAYIKAFNAGELDEFGSALSLSADGNTLAVGSEGEDGSGQGLGVNEDDASDRAGAVYLFRRDGTAWRATRYIKAPNAEGADEFGANLALSGDGQTLAVLASSEDSAATGIGGDQTDNTAANSGAVYLY